VRCVTPAATVAVIAASSTLMALCGLPCSLHTEQQADEVCFIEDMNIEGTTSNAHARNERDDVHTLTC
jgi:hypothetical protein